MVRAVVGDSTLHHHGRCWWVCLLVCFQTDAMHAALSAAFRCRSTDSCTASAITIASSALTLTIAVTKVVRSIRYRDEIVQKLGKRFDLSATVIREVQKSCQEREGVPPDEDEIDILKQVETVIGSYKDDLHKFEAALGKLESDRQNPVARVWREQRAAPLFESIGVAIKEHHNALNLLLHLHEKYVT